ncbi:hypothetical protein [Nonomuraea sp. NPDC050783]|uniref:hypothetical protein n=1 Tax=Nonomuraea sp. NPDC050783 TaxID=3154634 RepID=UPI003465D6E5
MRPHPNQVPRGRLLLVAFGDLVKRRPLAFEGGQDVGLLDPIDHVAGGEHGSAEEIERFPIRPNT